MDLGDASRREAEQDQGLESDARSLMDRRSAGELADEELELAAWTGDPAARLALDAPPPCWDDVEAFAHGVERLGGLAAVRRFGLALVTELQTIPPATKDAWTTEGRKTKNLEAAAICPCAAHCWGYGDPGPATCGTDAPSRNLVRVEPVIFLGAEGLRYTLVNVFGRRRGHLPAALAKGGEALAQWVLWGQDPLRAGWATGTTRLTPQALEAAELAALNLKDPGERIQALVSLTVGEVVDPRWSARLHAYSRLVLGQRAEPKNPLGAPDAKLSSQGDSEGMWLEFCQRMGEAEDEVKKSLLRGFPSIAELDFNF